MSSRSGLLFCEIICTYRLLFGQHQNSWKAFRADYGGRSTPEQLQECYHPLLARFCGHDWSTQLSYDDLETPTAKGIYSVDFTFFGERLLDLQHYVVEQTADSWRTLWRDRRDMNRFRTLWAVLIIGIATIVLAVIQVILGAAQVGGKFHRS